MRSFFWKFRYKSLITYQWILVYQIWCMCHLQNWWFFGRPPIKGLLFVVLIMVTVWYRIKSLLGGHFFVTMVGNTLLSTWWQQHQWWELEQVHDIPGYNKSLALGQCYTFVDDDTLNCFHLTFVYSSRAGHMYHRQEELPHSFITLCLCTHTPLLTSQLLVQCQD